MGLFGGLFDKKHCAICGGDIGLLGNRKLEDGNLCKNCAKQLSPWFSDRRHSTVAEIADQLRYRDENRRRVAAFRPTRTYGYFTKLYIDDNMQAFMVTSSNDWMRDNPDVIDYAYVVDCCADIHEDRREVLQKIPDAPDRPFQPRRFDYDYDFYIHIHVNLPWFDEIRFSLKTSVDDDRRHELDECITMSEDIVETMTGARPNLSPRVPYHPPFCRRCGRDLPLGGGMCICERMEHAPAHAPMPGHAPAPAPVGHAPAPAPVSHTPAPAPRQPAPAPAQNRPAPAPAQNRPAAMPGPDPRSNAIDQLKRNASGQGAMPQQKGGPAQSGPQRAGNGPAGDRGPGGQGRGPMSGNGPQGRGPRG